VSDPVILDPRALERLREWGGDRLLSQMLRLFLENAPTRMDQIREGASGPDLKPAEQGAHSLKSSAANVGAEALRDRSAAMERAAADGNRSEVQSILPEIELAYSRTVEALRSVQKEEET